MNTDFNTATQAAPQSQSCSTAIEDDRDTPVVGSDVDDAVTVPSVNSLHLVSPRVTFSSIVQVIEVSRWNEDEEPPACGQFDDCEFEDMFQTCNYFQTGKILPSPPIEDAQKTWDYGMDAFLGATSTATATAAGTTPVTKGHILRIRKRSTNRRSKKCTPVVVRAVQAFVSKSGEETAHASF